VSELDAAALHPALQDSGDERLHCFAVAAELRRTAKTRLLKDLGADRFSGYLTHNTTAGLLAVWWAAARAGHEVSTRGPQTQHYPAYADILPRGSAEARWEFRTHVSPVTGAVDPLTGDEGRTIVADAAQSLGTCLTETLLDAADVIVAPTHKHLGLCLGGGIVLVRQGVARLEQVHAVLAVAEAGAQSLDHLRRLASALSTADGWVFNRAQFVVDDDLRSWCAKRGLRPLGNGTGVPFVCVTTVDGGPIGERMALNGWRHMAAANVARFSRHLPGRAHDTPVDYTDEFRRAVEQAQR
jgi:hypothetical protein